MTSNPRGVQPIVRAYRARDGKDVVELWHDCGLVRSWNDPKRDIQRKLDDDPDGFLVLELDGRLVGAVMAGYDGHRGWINYLAVRPDCQRQGFGRLLMDEAEAYLASRGCPKMNLQVRGSNTAAVEFYRRLGFVQDDVISLGKRLVQDE